MSKNITIIEKERLEYIDQMLRSSRSVEARRALKDLLEKKLPREQLAQIANLTRRAGLATDALKLLIRIVRPPSQSAVKANDLEKSEYAAALINVGASREALGLLKTVQSEKTPEALLFEAFAHITHWDYDLSIPLLEKFIVHPDVPDYRRFVGKVNLASALVYVKNFKKAQEVLDFLIENTKEQKMDLLRINVLELSTFNQIFQNNFSEAQKYLTEAFSVLRDPHSLAGLLLRKAEIVLALAKGEEKNRNLVQLKEIKREGEKGQHWEFVRDCDYYLAIHNQSKDHFARLYFGTPFNSFRKRLRDEYANIFKEAKADYPPNKFDLHIGKGVPEFWIHAENGKNSKNDSFLKPSQIQQRLLNCLVVDFYRPLNIGTLHALLFPDRFFNPVTSSGVVRQAIIRLRSWFEKNRLPLQVLYEKGFYRLSSKTPSSVRVYLEHESKGSLHPEIEKFVKSLRKIFSHDEFSTAEAAKSLKMSERTVSRYLKNARDFGLLKQSGFASRTRFTIQKAS